jgi:hypothetical protein
VCWDTQLAEGGAEVGGAKLAAPVGERVLRSPTRRLRLGRDTAGELRGLGAGRVAAGEVASLAQANEEAMSIAVNCQTEPFVPCRRRSSHAGELAGAAGLQMPLGLRLPQSL